MQFLARCWRDLRDELKALDGGKLMVVPIAYLLVLLAFYEFFGLFG